jgi:hypothetical protein
MTGHESATGAPPRWTFNAHGPFYRLQRRLGLLRDDNLASGRRALLFVALAWLPLALLAALQGVAFGEHHERALLFDYGVYAFAIAIAAFVMMEQSSDARMRWLVEEFTRTGIAATGGSAGFARARENMARRTGSALAEALLLALSYATAWYWLNGTIERVDGGTWAGRINGGRLDLTLAGWWALLVSLPLFTFLLGRWLWRFYTWGALLADIARCELRLVATHPDGCGGLAFIGKYPMTYMQFVFALSTVVSAAVLKQVVYAGASLMSFKFALAGMVVFLVVAFALPLLSFTPVLLALKRQGLSLYGALASRHNLAFEARWVGAGGTAEPPAGEEALGTPDISSLADLAAGYELVQKMKPAPITVQGLVPLVLAALVPVAVVAATQVPVKQVLGEVKKLLLL